MVNAIAFVATTRTGRHDRLEQLLADGPPLAPAEAGFARHAVLLGEGEVVFVFEGPDPIGRVERLSAERTLLRQTLRVAGLIQPPRPCRASCSFGAGAAAGPRLASAG